MSCPARMPRTSPPTTTRAPSLPNRPSRPDRPGQIELLLPRRADADRLGIEARVGAALDALPAPAAGSAFAWHELREGVREVVLTLMATVALGLGWAALEAGWANAEWARTGDATALETGYAPTSPAPR